MVIFWKFIMRVRADGCTGLASMLAYSFFLTLPAVLILMVAALAYVPVENLSDKIGEQLQGVLPTDALSLVERTLERTFSHGRTHILVLSLVGSLYVMSNGYAGLISSLNHIYGLKESRPWLKVRLRALVMSVIAAGFILSAFSLVTIVPAIVGSLSGDMGTSETLALWLSRMRWPGIIILAFLGIEGTYRYAPCGGPRWRIVSPGTLFAEGAWLLSTLVFSFYVDNYGSYDNIYGTLGAVIVLLTWMWISAMMFLIGAEINIMWWQQRGRGTPSDSSR